VLWSTRALRATAAEQRSVLACAKRSCGRSNLCWWGFKMIRRPGRFPGSLVLLGFPLSPIGQVAAGTAIELRRNVVVTSWAGTAIVCFGFHWLRASFKKFRVMMTKSPGHRAMRIWRKFQSRLFGVKGSFMIFGIASPSWYWAMETYEQSRCQTGVYRKAGRKGETLENLPRIRGRNVRSVAE